MMPNCCSCTDNEEYIKYLDAQTYENPPEILFKIGENTYTPDAVMVKGVAYDLSSGHLVKNLLYVPGVGNIIEGSRVVYQNKDYVLRFGWHTNISNQTIYSWYLESINEDICPKTLYFDMINKITLVHFR